MSRERSLLELVGVMWCKLTPGQQQETLQHCPTMAWAIPTTDVRRHDDDMLTTAEVAQAYGVRPATVWSWPGRYGIKSCDGKWRWGDVQGVRLKQMVNRRDEAA